MEGEECKYVIAILWMWKDTTVHIPILAIPMAALCGGNFTFYKLGRVFSWPTSVIPSLDEHIDVWLEKILIQYSNQDTLSFCHLSQISILKYNMTYNM